MFLLNFVVDYIFYGIPKDRFELQALLFAAKRLYYAGSYNDGWGEEINIAGELRKAKQMQKKAYMQERIEDQQAVIQEYLGEKKEKPKIREKRQRAVPAGMR